METKDPTTGLSYELTSACHAMAKGNGWKEFVAKKTDGKRFAISDFTNANDHDPEAPVQITKATLAEWAVEYGLQRLRAELAEIGDDLPLFKAA